MSYTYELENGQELVIENDGGETLVSLSSGSESQQQSQATGFDTGKWSKAPTLFQLEGAALETKDGPQFIRVRGDSIQRMKSEPDLQAAEKLRLKKSDEAAGMTPMQPMRPFRFGCELSYTVSGPSAFIFNGSVVNNAFQRIELVVRWSGRSEEAPSGPPSSRRSCHSIVNKWC